jgi:hypothetical protein
MAEKQPDDAPPLIHPTLGLRAEIFIERQRFNIPLDCGHRSNHIRRLTVLNPATLPLLNRVTSLHVPPGHHYSYHDGSMACVRPLSFGTLFDLAARLPYLRELKFHWLWESFPIAFESRALRVLARVWAGPWRESRVEFARAVRRALPLLPPSLTRARLWFWRPYSYGDEFDQAAQMPDLVNTSALSLSSSTTAAAEFKDTTAAVSLDYAAQMPGLVEALSLSSLPPLSPSSSTTSEFNGVDPVSLGLQALGGRLEELDVRAVITPDLFPSGDDSTPWPSMRHLKVEFYPCAPDGRWYFSGPRDENPCPTGFAITREEHYQPGLEDHEELQNLLWEEDDEMDHKGEGLDSLRQPDMFRTCPIAEHVNPLLLAFASSLQHKMPALEDAELFTWLTWRPSEARAQEYEGSDDVPPLGEWGTTLFRWGVRYDAPKGDGKGKVTWRVSQDWKPSDEVVKAFEELVGGDGENVKWEAFEFVAERPPLLGIHDRA